jgi:hypothetical protein
VLAAGSGKCNDGKDVSRTQSTTGNCRTQRREWLVGQKDIVRATTAATGKLCILSGHISLNGGIAA